MALWLSLYDVPSGQNIETEVRRRAFDHLQKPLFSFYDNSKTGNLITHC